MTPKWQKVASLAQEICTLLFQFVGAVFASKAILSYVESKCVHICFGCLINPNDL